MTDTHSDTHTLRQTDTHTHTPLLPLKIWVRRVSKVKGVSLGAAAYCRVAWGV